MRTGRQIARKKVSVLVAVALALVATAVLVTVRLDPPRQARAAEATTFTGSALAPPRWVPQVAGTTDWRKCIRTLFRHHRKMLRWKRGKAAPFR